ncbi:MAG: PIN domain-containing protein, partial [Candidatus Acidiferrales bacterium]
MTPSSRKKLFLVDAMGYIFRAYHAPMERLQTRDGTPTKVPYLFATMMRRLLESKTLKPDYLAVVYDVLAPTFRDKLFTQYKAQRPPMPDDLAVQLPFVRRYCEAMRFPIVELAGYEADDVIASLAR